MFNKLMQSYYDLKTIYKIIILVTTMSVFMSVLGFIGFYFNQQSHKSIEIIYEHNLQPIRWINIFRITLNANRANVLALILEKNKEKQKLYLDDINKRAKEGTENLNEFTKSMESLNNQIALDKLKELNQKLEEYRTNRSKIINMAMEGKQEQAFQAYKDNASLAKELFGIVGELATNIQQRAEKRNEATKSEGLFANITIIATIVIAILLSIGIAFFIATRIRLFLKSWKLK